MTLPERATNMPSASLPGVDPAADFVINSGRYFHGTTGRPYQPVVKLPDPLPAAAYLYWGLRAQGASGEYDRLLCALQRHTGVGVNAFSIKNSGGQLGFEIYVTMYPPMLRAMHGRDMPHMQSSEYEPDLNYFLRFEQEHFNQPRRVYDQARFGLTHLFAMHFDLDARLLQERNVPAYTLSTRVGPERTLPQHPGLWKGYVWTKTDYTLITEQHGFVVDPVAHEREMLGFLAEAIAKEGWPDARPPEPRDFLIPWLFEHSRDHHQLLGLTHKPYKGGLGVYYRLDYPHLLRFAREFAYPEPFIADLARHRERLEHLLFDVAVAYKVKDGATRPSRSAIYGMV